MYKVTRLSYQSDYTSIKRLLKIAIHENDTYKDEYIKIVVRDAKMVYTNPSSVNVIDQDAYRYSVPLARLQRPEIMSMCPEQLTIDDFRLLLEFFEML